MSFVGLVLYVKEYPEQQRRSEGQSSGYVTSHIDLESTDDKSRVALFVKHARNVDLKNTLQKGYVLVVRDALRKISNQIDIYTQL